MGEPEPVVKLNKDTLEAALVQIEYLKTAKKDQIALLCKLFDGRLMILFYSVKIDYVYILHYFNTI